MDDESILELFLERSEAALDAMNEKYGAACLRLAENILGSREDAEECVNDALLRVWSSVPPNKPEMLGAYALRIVRNLALNRLGYRGAGKRSAAALCLEELAECIPSRGCVESAAEDAELSRLIDGFARGLGREDRFVFVRRYWYLESTKETARALGTTDAAVRSRLARIRKRLKKHLEANGVII